MLDRKIIEEALDYYNIDKIYLDKCIECINEIKNNEQLKEKVEDLIDFLFNSPFLEVRKLWSYKTLEELLEIKTPIFTTNVLLLLGMNTHKENMQKFKFSKEQVSIHKKRMKECFENDIKIRKCKEIRLSQLIWSMFFIHGRLLEIGNLQFEYSNDNLIKIHIPKNTDFSIEKTINSIEKSKKELRKVYKITDFKYECHSWLISNQIKKITEEKTNIKHFQDLFNVTDGGECQTDILNFIFERETCSNYNELPEKTSLQRKVKTELLKGTIFHIGLGVLKDEIK